jgi:hypothetical protein
VNEHRVLFIYTALTFGYVPFSFSEPSMINKRSPLPSFGFVCHFLLVGGAVPVVISINHWFLSEPVCPVTMGQVSHITLVSPIHGSWPTHWLDYRVRPNSFRFLTGTTADKYTKDGNFGCHVEAYTETCLAAGDAPSAYIGCFYSLAAM